MELITEELSGVRRLVARVCLRQGVRQLLSRFALASLGWSVGFLGVVLVSRLTALIPDVFTTASILAVPGLGLLTALLFYKPTSQEEGARLIDHAEGSNDLFLTALSLRKNPGEFVSLVAEKAVTVANEVKPSRIAPIRWEAKFGYLAVALLALVAIVALTPQLDPFHKREQAEKTDERVKKLEESRIATAQQAEALEQKNIEERGQAIDRELAKLKESFRSARPELKEQTRRELSERQMELGKLLNQVSKEKLRDALSKSKAGQKFGAQSPARKEFRKMAEEGEFEDLQKAMEEMKEKLKDLAAKPNSLERRKEMEELREKMQAMADAMSEVLGSENLDKAMSRALEQMDMSSMQDLAQQAMEAMQESMDLSQEELKNLADALKGMEDLQEALSAAQLAKVLNEMGQLNGAGEGDPDGMGDYEKLYRDLLADRTGQNPGNGEGGTGGEGKGKGGVVPEDPSAKTAFRSEKSRSALQKGKLLMNIKSKGSAEPGEVQDAYRSSVGVLREAASEAILQEQIPPGYHESIRDYFDQLGTDVGNGESTNRN